MAVKLAPPILNVFRLALGRPEPSGQLALLWLIATACEQNLPLASAVDAMAADARKQWKFRLEDFAALLRRGRPIEDAVQMVPDLLPPEALLAAKVGAASGNVGPALRAEAERMAAEQDEFDKPTIVGAVIYSGAVLAICSSILGFLMVWIVPKYMKIFDDFGLAIPPITESLIEFMDGPGQLALIPIATFLFAVPLFGIAWLFGFRMTVFNPLRFFPRLDSGPILRQLGIAVEKGGSLLDALKTVSTQHPHTATWRRMSHVYEAVSAGEKPWGMMQERKMITSRERQLLESAERVGNLGWALQLLGRHVESQQDHRLQASLRLIRPILIGLIGAFVGWVALAMYSPLIKLISDLT